MASLALMVSIIFLSILLSGPLSLIFNYFNMPIMATLFGVFSIVSGAYWCCFAPFPVSIIGIISAACGAYSISRL